jgi:hypothetical protein
MAAAVPLPPATSSVSIEDRREARSVLSDNPDDVVIGCPEAETTAVA